MQDKQLIDDLDEIDNLTINQKVNELYEDEDFRSKDEDYIYLKNKGLKMMKIKNLNFLSELKLKK